MNAYVYWVCGFKMSENQQKVSKSGVSGALLCLPWIGFTGTNAVSRKASSVHFCFAFLSIV